MEQKKALFIDDDSAYLWKLIDAVKPLGFECLIMSDSLEASRMLASERFDVLVTDIAMPGMDGYEVIRKLRSRDNDTFIIAISGQNDESVARRALKNGADIFFPKPLELENFLETFQHLSNGDSKSGNGLP